MSRFTPPPPSNSSSSSSASRQNTTTIVNKDQAIAKSQSLALQASKLSDEKAAMERSSGAGGGGYKGAGSDFPSLSMGGEGAGSGGKGRGSSQSARQMQQQSSVRDVRDERRDDGRREERRERDLQSVRDERNPEKRRDDSYNARPAPSSRREEEPRARGMNANYKFNSSAPSSSSSAPVPNSASLQPTPTQSHHQQQQSSSLSSGRNESSTYTSSYPRISDRQSSSDSRGNSSSSSSQHRQTSSYQTNSSSRNSTNSNDRDRDRDRGDIHPMLQPTKSYAKITSLKADFGFLEVLSYPTSPYSPPPQSSTSENNGMVGSSMPPMPPSRSNSEVSSNSLFFHFSQLVPETSPPSSSQPVLDLIPGAFVEFYVPFYATLGLSEVPSDVPNSHSNSRSSSGSRSGNNNRLQASKVRVINASEVQVVDEVESGVVRVGVIIKGPSTGYNSGMNNSINRRRNININNNNNNNNEASNSSSIHDDDVTSYGQIRLITPADFQNSNFHDALFADLFNGVKPSNLPIPHDVLSAQSNDGPVVFPFKLPTQTTTNTTLDSDNNGNSNSNVKLRPGDIVTFALKTHKKHHPPLKHQASITSIKPLITALQVTKINLTVKLVQEYDGGSRSNVETGVVHRLHSSHGVITCNSSSTYASSSRRDLSFKYEDVILPVASDESYEKLKFESEGDGDEFDLSEGQEVEFLRVSFSSPSPSSAMNDEALRVKFLVKGSVGVIESVGAMECGRVVGVPDVSINGHGHGHGKQRNGDGNGNNNSQHRTSNKTDGNVDDANGSSSSSSGDALSKDDCYTIQTSLSSSSASASAGFVLVYLPYAASIQMNPPLPPLKVGDYLQNGAIRICRSERDWMTVHDNVEMKMYAGGERYQGVITTVNYSNSNSHHSSHHNSSSSSSSNNNGSSGGEGFGFIKVLNQSVTLPQSGSSGDSSKVTDCYFKLSDIIQTAPSYSSSSSSSSSTSSKKFVKNPIAVGCHVEFTIPNLPSQTSSQKSSYTATRILPLPSKSLHTDLTLSSNAKGVVTKDLQVSGKGGGGIVSGVIELEEGIVLGLDFLKGCNPLLCRVMETVASGSLMTSTAASASAAASAAASAVHDGESEVDGYGYGYEGERIGYKINDVKNLCVLAKHYSVGVKTTEGTEVKDGYYTIFKANPEDEKASASASASIVDDYVTVNVTDADADRGKDRDQDSTHTIKSVSYTKPSCIQNSNLSGLPYIGDIVTFSVIFDQMKHQSLSLSLSQTSSVNVECIARGVNIVERKTIQRAAAKPSSSPSPPLSTSTSTPTTPSTTHKGVVIFVQTPRRFGFINVDPSTLTADEVTRIEKSTTSNGKPGSAKGLFFNFNGVNYTGLSLTKPMMGAAEGDGGNIHAPAPTPAPAGGVGVEGGGSKDTAAKGSYHNNTWYPPTSTSTSTQQQQQQQQVIQIGQEVSFTLNFDQRSGKVTATNINYLPPGSVSVSVSVSLPGSNPSQAIKGVKKEDMCVGVVLLEPTYTGLGGREGLGRILLLSDPKQVFTKKLVSVKLPASNRGGSFFGKKKGEIMFRGRVINEPVEAEIEEAKADGIDLSVGGGGGEEEGNSAETESIREKTVKKSDSGNGDNEVEGEGTSAAAPSPPPPPPNPPKYEISSLPMMLPFRAPSSGRFGAQSSSNPHATSNQPKRGDLVLFTGSSKGGGGGGKAAPVNVNDVRREGAVGGGGRVVNGKVFLDGKTFFVSSDRAADGAKDNANAIAIANAGTGRYDFDISKDAVSDNLTVGDEVEGLLLSNWYSAAPNANASGIAGIARTKDLYITTTNQSLSLTTKSSRPKLNLSVKKSLASSNNGLIVAMSGMAVGPERGGDGDVLKGFHTGWTGRVSRFANVDKGEDVMVEGGGVSGSVSGNGSVVDGASEVPVE